LTIVVNVSAFSKALSGIRSELPSVIERSLTTLAEIGATNAKSSRIFKNRTGNLRKNIKFTVDGEYARSVIADTGYAFYVEFGNNQKGDKIYPKRAKALRFVIDGEVIFRKWVKSHGPLPFLGPARELVVSMAPVILGGDVERLIQKHSRGT
jgi:hypothetical protein